MNSVIEAQETFLEFCPWNWKADRYYRITQKWMTINTPHYFSRTRNVEAEKMEDEMNKILSDNDRRMRQIRLLDEQRKA